MRYSDPRGAAVLALAFAALLLAGCAEPLPKLTYAERPCYRTLAVVDCHAEPLPGEEGRRVGFYDTPIAVDYESWPQRLF
ncbi:MAG: hypothetical protein ACFCUW_04805 [Kiloniellaceae bacterium]